MKIRNGFVSNSSSTSFCIIGTYVDSLDDIKCINHFNLDEWYNHEDEIDDIMAKYQLCIYIQEDGAYIGIPLEDANDDETLGAIKKKVNVNLRKAIGKPVKSKLLYGEILT